jgi:spore photoproduct lyase
MKREKKEKATVKTQKITRFIEPSIIQIIKHPETYRFQQVQKLAWKGNRIVLPFHKIPPDIACGVFWELRWAYGCPFDCNYCYLRGTMRGRMKPQYVKTEHVLEALDEAFAKIPWPTIFNAGELSDALMNPKMIIPIVDKFEEQNKHKIYLLTKFGIKNIQFLLDKPRKQVICCWSINAPTVAKLWEKAAASPYERIKAATLVKNAGYDTRIRIDPIFPISNWKEEYHYLINELLSHLTPNRIILGTPRGLWKTIEYAKRADVDMSWAQFFKEDTSWGKKLSFEQRKEIYQFFFDELDSAGYPLSKVSICKETVEMWNTLGLHHIPGMCNCYGKSAFNP